MEEEHIITLHIPPGWRGKRWMESSGVMRVNLDKMAERCGNRAYTFHPYPPSEVTEMQVTVDVFRKVCNLIVKYAKEKDFETAEEVFTKAENPKVRKIWDNAKTKFETKRNRTDPSYT